MTNPQKPELQTATPLELARGTADVALRKAQEAIEAADAALRETLVPVARLQALAPGSGPFPLEPLLRAREGIGMVRGHVSLTLNHFQDPMPHGQPRGLLDQYDARSAAAGQRNLAVNLAGIPIIG